MNTNLNADSQLINIIYVFLTKKIWLKLLENKKCVYLCSVLMD